MGHTIDRLNYDKAANDTEWTEKCYRQMMPWLNIMSEIDPEVIQNIEENIVSKHQAQMDVLYETIETLKEQMLELQRGKKK